MMLQGQGIQGSIAPEEDPLQLVASDEARPADIGLTYVVPDMSTELGIALPGGEVVSVEHPDHPGDQHRDLGR